MTSQAEDDVTKDFDLSVYKDLFLEQAATFMATLRQSLAQLQDNPDNQRALREARRATHTLRGMAATMHYTALSEMAAELEKPFLSGASLPLDQITAVLVGCEEFEKGLVRLE